MSRAAEFGSVASRLVLSQASTLSPVGLLSMAAIRHCRRSVVGDLEKLLPLVSGREAFTASEPLNVRGSDEALQDIFVAPEVLGPAEQWADKVVQWAVLVGDGCCTRRSIQWRLARSGSLWRWGAPLVLRADSGESASLVLIRSE